MKLTDEEMGLPTTPSDIFEMINIFDGKFKIKWKTKAFNSFWKDHLPKL